jgi:hypothetical protein
MLIPMKRQYFGDINDFHKYGLLQILCRECKLRLGVCWMLTPDDGRNDGSRTGYLSFPARWRAYNPQLFDFLLACVRGSRRRDMTLLQSLNVLPRAEFYTHVLTDSDGQRQSYFSGMRKKFARSDIIFFDPDNGFEVQSIPLGSRKSSKYIYWREVSDAYRAKHSVLIYQHFRREQRTRFVATLAATLKRKTGALEVYSFRTAHVAFFLAPQPRHEACFGRAAQRVQETWAGEFEVRHHRAKYPIEGRQARMASGASSKAAHRQALTNPEVTS